MNGFFGYNAFRGSEGITSVPVFRFISRVAVASILIPPLAVVIEGDGYPPWRVANDSRTFTWPCLLDNQVIWLAGWSLARSTSSSRSGPASAGVSRNLEGRLSFNILLATVSWMLTSSINSCLPWYHRFAKQDTNFNTTRVPAVAQKPK